MALTMGSVSVLAVGSTTDSLSTAAPSTGTGPYTYQWYRGGSATFTVAGSSSISGATASSVAQSGLTPATTYFYRVVATDSAGTPDTGTSAGVQVVTGAAQPSPNQFSQAPFLGQADLHFNGDTISALFDQAGSGTLVAGQAVKWSTTSTQSGATNGMPLIVPCTADTDTVAGFVNYNIKDATFAPGATLEISMWGNVMYLQAVNAVLRGAQVYSLNSAQIGGVSTATSGKKIAGYALDTGAAGTLIRVFIQTPTPSYAVV